MSTLIGDSGINTIPECRSNADSLYLMPTDKKLIEDIINNLKNNTVPG